MVSYLIIYFKKHKTQWNSREGTANSSRDVYWAKVNQQLTLPRRYSQLAAVGSLRVRNPRYRSSSETVFVRKICSWTELFVNRGVREPRFQCIADCLSRLEILTVVSENLGALILWFKHVGHYLQIEIVKDPRRIEPGGLTARGSKSLQWNYDFLLFITKHLNMADFFF
jgi:hypothetical protein